MKYRLEECLPLSEMELDAMYEGFGRNFNVGVWNGEGFLGERHKFSMVFEDLELHWDADDRYGTFQPIRKLADSKLRCEDWECITPADDEAKCRYCGDPRRYPVINRKDYA